MFITRHRESSQIQLQVGHKQGNSQESHHVSNTDLFCGSLMTITLSQISKQIFMEMSTFGIHITLRSVPTPNVYHTNDEIPGLYDNNFNYKNIIKFD